MARVRRWPVVEIVVAGAAIAALAIGGAITGRQVQHQVSVADLGSTYSAASTGYRAWYELLTREGVPVQRFERRPAWLDPSVDVYVTASDEIGGIARAASGGAATVFVDADWYALNNWVKDGGHLVWIADGVASPADLNVPSLERSAGPSQDNALPLLVSTLTNGVRAVSGTSRVRVPFEHALGAAPVIADDTGGVVVTYPLGQGSVTVVTDESLFENGRIAKADNARLAFDLASAGLRPHGSVAFDEWSHGYAAGDTWWSVLPLPLREALIAIACVLVALAVGTAFRFGPVAPVEDASERTSAEYLTSMALLFRRGRSVRAPLVEMAGACLRDVAARLGLSDAASARVIAARAGNAAGDGMAEAVMDLDRLRSYENPSEGDLLRAAALCTALRKEFGSHARIGTGRRFAHQRRPA